MKINPELEMSFEHSKQNFRDMESMIAEMEACGERVLRRGSMGCGAVLVVPEIVLLSASEGHTYHPNAVAELYEKWKEWKAK